MCGLPWSTTKPAVGVLPVHDSIDRPKHTSIQHSATRRRRRRAPLLGIRIDGDLERAERLERPEHEPRLARILAHVACWEALDEIADEKLQVRILVQDSSATVWRELLLQGLFGVGLQVRRFGWVRIDRRWSRHAL